MKIGITGATGQLGRLVVDQLKQISNSENLVALVRNTQKAKDLGIEAREFDYSKPDSLAGSLEGIDSLLLISGSEIGKREEQHKNVINAAKEAGVKWIVYTSLLHADTSSLSLAAEHVATEAELKESGIVYTILRNGWYTENYSGSIPGALENGAFVGSAGDGKISSAARVDYAEAAAVVLTSKNQNGKVYELAGDKYFTLADLAYELSKQTNKDIQFRNVPETEYAQILKGAGLPDSIADAVANWDTSIAKNDLFDDSHQLSKLIGRPTTPMPQTVKEILANLK